MPLAFFVHEIFDFVVFVMVTIKTMKNVKLIEKGLVRIKNDKPIASGT